MRARGAGVALALAFFAFYFVVAATIGFHGPTASWDAYGEPPTGGWVQEPICFWTNLAFILAGLACLRRLDLASRDAAPNPMAAASPASVGFGLLIVWMGPASMLEHGTLTKTWGWFDATSIHWFAIFVSTYLLARVLRPSLRAKREGEGGKLRRWRLARIAVIVAGLGTTIGVGVVTWRSESLRLTLTQALLALVSALIVGAFALGRFVGLRFRRGAWRVFAGAALAFAAGTALLILGARGAPLAPWAHGGWHLACAVAMYLVMQLLALETQETP